MNPEPIVELEQRFNVNIRVASVDNIPAGWFGETPGNNRPWIGYFRGQGGYEYSAWGYTLSDLVKNLEKALKMHRQ